mgnify:CR=1 FL=1
MTTLEHTAMTLLAIKEGKCNYDFNKIIPYALLPDSIRMYTGERQLSHFERSYSGDDVSYMVYPEDIKNMTRESIAADKTTDDYYLSSDIKPCCIGEETVVEAFYEHNSHLPAIYQAGVGGLHLPQDKLYDELVRLRDNVDQAQQKKQIADGTMTENMPNAYDGRFTLKDGRNLGAQEYRQYVAEQSAFEFYCLACIINDKYPDIILDQDWMDENLKPSLDKAYPQEMADNTYKFMKIPSQLNEWIKTQDKSHIHDIPGVYDRMATFAEKVLDQYESDKIRIPAKQVEPLKESLMSSEKTMQQTSELSC